ncbi:hypothetical protein E2A64_01650 [Pseudohoeflea suaedae]|uniref:Alkaline proteinase inhibitor/ Outer membrane lipoprotein Omp19 domain-containing protein n=1 Tax=Pseudohoeflea suaedae TaxID=877384 RepID=A0A4R5PLW5_9HYPH|nr:hypothetical protein [Pseudohoeflea suaedae]TDH37869.1 hypothetical protein E2A64_01650 [Pseudohoeflea suaedae]
MTNKAVCALGALALLAGCQSAPTTQSSATTQAGMAAAPQPATTAQAIAEGQAVETQSGYCARPISGPPPKPAKGGDFVKNGIGNNLKRNVARNSISMLGGAIAGPLGGAVAQGIASDQIRTEQDLKGEWAITDGRPDCGCTISISSGTNLKMESSKAGKLTAESCQSPFLAQAARWSLGHTFTGYDAPLAILASDRKTVLVKLNRDGINYFSGTLADGTPVTMWRRGG